MHVRIAWEIYHHQQKQPPPSSSSSDQLAHKAAALSGIMSSASASSSASSNVVAAMANSAAQKLAVSIAGGSASMSNSTTAANALSKAAAAAAASGQASHNLLQQQQQQQQAHDIHRPLNSLFSLPPRPHELSFSSSLLSAAAGHTAPRPPPLDPNQLNAHHAPHPYGPLAGHPFHTRPSFPGHFAGYNHPLNGMHLPPGAGGPQHSLYGGGGPLGPGRDPLSPAHLLQGLNAMDPWLRNAAMGRAGPPGLYPPLTPPVSTSSALNNAAGWGGLKAEAERENRHSHNDGLSDHPSLAIEKLHRAEESVKKSSHHSKHNDKSDNSRNHKESASSHSKSSSADVTSHRNNNGGSNGDHHPPPPPHDPYRRSWEHGSGSPLSTFFEGHILHSGTHGLH